MKICWRCGESKPETEFHSDKSRGDGRACRCMFCVKQQAADWYARNATVMAAKHRASYVPKRQPKTAEQRRLAHLAKCAEYRKANKGRIKVWVAGWARANPEKRAAQVRAYQTKKRNARPAWANEFFMEEAYRLAKLRTEMFGFDWHVDHIVPIKSKFVCGLHTHDNLQVIPGADNLGKGNRHWPDMPANH